MFLYQQIFFSTLAVSFGILHLILFLYNRSFKSDLFFAIFLFLYALNIFFDYQATLAGETAEALIYLRIHRAVMPYNSVFILLFLYYAFDFKIPKHFWVITAGIVITGFFAVLEPINNFNYVQIVQIFVGIEAIRILTIAVKNKNTDAWIITTGFTLLFLFSTYDLLMDFGLINPVAEITNGYPFGFLCLIVFASIYLARDFARANKTILIKEREAKEMEIAQRILEAEDKRKAKELNEARDLQLSLLPQCITNLNNYDFCFNMRPANEVGGDYYDYNISESGEISIVIGDATDHGMKAGMMVSIIKSLFLTHIENLEIKEFLNSCSNTIKQMKLKNLYMALMIVKINGSQLTMSSAGIPPMLVYRKKTDTVDEYKIKGMPLGAVKSFPYETVNIELETGDVVLLMTDGLSEQFNKDKESFGDDRLKKVFLHNACKPVTEIIDGLLLSGKEWMGENKQNDDITFIAFRYKE